MVQDIPGRGGFRRVISNEPAHDREHNPIPDTDGSPMMEAATYPVESFVAETVEADGTRNPTILTLDPYPVSRVGHALEVGNFEQIAAPYDEVVDRLSDTRRDGSYIEISRDDVNFLVPEQDPDVAAQVQALQEDNERLHAENEELAAPKPKNLLEVDSGVAVQVVRTEDDTLPGAVLIEGGRADVAPAYGMEMEVLDPETHAVRLYSRGTEAVAHDREGHEIVVTNLTLPTREYARVHTADGSLAPNLRVPFDRMPVDISVQTRNPDGEIVVKQQRGNVANLFPRLQDMMRPHPSRQAVVDPRGPLGLDPLVQPAPPPLMTDAEIRDLQHRIEELQAQIPPPKPLLESSHEHAVETVRGSDETLPGVLLHQGGGEDASLYTNEVSVEPVDEGTGVRPYTDGTQEDIQVNDEDVTVTHLVLPTTNYRRVDARTGDAAPPLDVSDVLTTFSQDFVQQERQGDGRLRGVVRRGQEVTDLYSHLEAELNNSDMIVHPDDPFRLDPLAAPPPEEPIRTNEEIENLLNQLGEADAQQGRIRQLEADLAALHPDKSEAEVQTEPPLLGLGHELAAETVRTDDDTLPGAILVQGGGEDQGSYSSHIR
jgi:hypothetical protein